MKKGYNYTETSELFLNIEKKYSLVEKEINGVYFWPLVRNRIHQNILQENDILNQAHHTVPRGLLNKIKSALHYLNNAFVNIFIPVRRADYLIVNHSRKVMRDGKYIDIYSSWLEQYLLEKGYKTITLDVPLNWSNHLIKRSERVRYIDNFGFVRKVLGTYFHSNQKQPSYLKDVSNELVDLFGTDGNLWNEVETQLINFKVDYKYFTKILKKTSPKRVFYVVKNNNHALIAACNSLKIPVTEIQHGIIHRYHLMYSYPYNKTVPYYPDRLCLFGPYWKKNVKNILSNDAFDYYRSDITYAKKCKSPDFKRTIIILSQPTIGEKLVNFIYDAKDYKDFGKYTWIFKLHPSEYEVWKRDYPKLQELSELANFSVIDASNPSLYELFNKCGIALGVQSTAIFEAIYFDCRPYIINLPSSDVLLAMFADTTDMCINSTKDLFEKISGSHMSESISSNSVFSDTIKVKL